MPGPTEATHEPPKKKMKASPGMSPENSSTENTTRQTSQKRPAEQTWADVVKTSLTHLRTVRAKVRTSQLIEAISRPTPESEPIRLRMQSSCIIGRCVGKRRSYFFYRCKKTIGSRTVADWQRHSVPESGQFKICKDLQNCTISQRNLLHLFGPPVWRRWLTQIRLFAHHCAGSSNFAPVPHSAFAKDITQGTAANGTCHRCLR